MPISKEKEPEVLWVSLAMSQLLAAASLREVLVGHSRLPDNSSSRERQVFAAATELIDCFVDEIPKQHYEILKSDLHAMRYLSDKSLKGKFRLWVFFADLAKRYELRCNFVREWKSQNSIEGGA